MLENPDKWRRALYVSLIVSALAASPPTCLWADGLEAGLWQLLTTPEINGVVAPPRKTTRCLTPEAVKDLDRTFSPISRTTNSACEQVEHQFTPQRLRWRLQCKGQLDMDVAGDFSFERPDRYTATIVARSSMLGRLMQAVRTKIEAHRIGECSESR
jgi:Protein of unknown function (DUF3617)